MAFIGFKVVRPNTNWASNKMKAKNCLHNFLSKQLGPTKFGLRTWWKPKMAFTIFQNSTECLIMVLMFSSQRIRARLSPFKFYTPFSYLWDVFELCIWSRFEKVVLSSPEYNLIIFQERTWFGWISFEKLLDSQSYEIRVLLTHN